MDVKELERKIRNLECPFCNYRTDSVNAYLRHVSEKHPLTSCPVCGFSGKNMLIHLSKRKDRPHRLLWALYGSFKKGNHSRPKKMMKIRDELWK